MSEEIKNCPACNGELSWCCYSPSENYGHEMWDYYCLQCGYRSLKEFSKEKAIKAANKQPYKDDLEAKVDRLDIIRKSLLEENSEIRDKNKKLAQQNYELKAKVKALEETNEELCNILDITKDAEAVCKMKSKNDELKAAIGKIKLTCRFFETNDRGKIDIIELIIEKLEKVQELEP